MLLTSYLAIALASCRSTESGLPDRWETYQNSRYDFEFPYPAGWQSSVPPENRDGIAFRDPRNPAVEIRGWASFLRSPNSSGKSSKNFGKAPVASKNSKPASTKTQQGQRLASSNSNNPTSSSSTPSSSMPSSSMPTNFTTEQGIQGTLQAKLGAQTSSLTLVLNHGGIQYYWQGSAPSQQFDAYYRFFNYVARRYRILNKS